MLGWFSHLRFSSPCTGAESRAWDWGQTLSSCHFVVSFVYSKSSLWEYSNTIAIKVISAWGAIDGFAALCFGIYISVSSFSIKLVEVAKTTRSLLKTAGLLRGAVANLDEAWWVWKDELLIKLVPPGVTILPFWKDDDGLGKSFVKLVC
jgi:hypothetical protein